MISSSEVGEPTLLDAPEPVPELQGPALAALRGPAVQRLLRLRVQGRLSRGHVSLAGECLGVSERTVWRWLAQAEAEPRAGAEPGARSVDRFEVTAEVRVLLAYWRGNASAVHRQLVARARAAAG